MRTCVLSLLLLTTMSIAVPVGADEPAPGPRLEIALTRNPQTPARHPASFAIWARERDSGAVATIFVTRKVGLGRFWGATERREALPVWLGIKDKDPAFAGGNVDAVTGATPETDYRVTWPVPAAWRGKTIEVFIEANVSFDYNGTYVRKGPPDSAIVSGVNGQPSVVWQTSLIAGDREQIPLTPALIGHGSVTGDDHAMDPDTSGITTARELFSRMTVAYRPR